MGERGHTALKRREEIYNKGQKVTMQFFLKTDAF